MFCKYLCSVLFYSAYFQSDGAKLVLKSDTKIGSDSIHFDLERVPSELLDSLNLLVDDSKLERLNSLADSQPQPGSEYHQAQFEDYDYEIDYGKISSDKDKQKRLADDKLDYGVTSNVYVNGSIKEYDYNFEEFKKEYDNEIIMTPVIPTLPDTHNLSVVNSDDGRPFQMTKTLEEENECLTMAKWKYLVFGIPCIWIEIKDIMGPGSFLNIFIILIKTLVGWFLVFAVVSPVIWCYNGMCCCYMTLDVFHPLEGVLKIKNQATLNPPGVEKLEDGTTKSYEPSKRELKAYRKLLKAIYN